MSNSSFSRRSFIKQAAVSPLIAGALTNSSTFAQRVPEPPGKKLGWAIVGLGNLAINQILPGFAKVEKSKIVALVSGHRDKADKLAARYAVRPQNIYNYENYEELKNNPEVDIIYIVLPNSMHAEYTIRGAQAGKHILSEKPMATSVKDGEDMIAACRRANKKLMIAYRCRYEPFNQNLIKLAQDKEIIGPIRAVVSDHGFNIGDPKQWRLNKALAGGGSLMDIGVYALNAARYCTGEEPTEINAMEFTDRSDIRFKEVEDMINFQLRFPSGALANCTSSYGYAGQNRIRVIGTKGWVELEPATGYTGARLRLRLGGQLTERDLQPKDHFAAEMDHFSECVMNDQEPLTSGEEGVRDLKYMRAIYEAAKTGKTIRL